METVKISGMPAPQSVYNGLSTLVSVSANTSWNWLTQQNAILPMTENTTLASPTNLKAGAVASLWIIQNATTAKELYYGPAYQPSTNLPLITTALSSVCYIQFGSPDGVSAVVTRFQQNLVI